MYGMYIATPLPKYIELGNQRPRVQSSPVQSTSLGGLQYVGHPPRHPRPPMLGVENLFAVLQVQWQRSTMGWRPLYRKHARACVLGVFNVKQELPCQPAEAVRRA